MKYKVRIRIVDYLEATIEADSFDDAFSAVEEMDEDEFVETNSDRYRGSISITDENGKEVYG